jgi:hypothetical protein
MDMTRTPASTTIILRIAAELTFKIMDIYCARKLKKVYARILTAPSPIIKFSNFTILADIKANSVKITISPNRGIPKANLSALMESFAPLLMTNQNYLLSLSTNSPELYSFICTFIRLSGVQSQLITIVRNVSMPIIFKILEEIQKNITMSLRNVQTGKKIKISKELKMLDVPEECSVISVTDGRKNSIILSFIASQKLVKLK